MSEATTDASILHASVRNALESAGLAYEVLACDETLADTAAFCEHYGFTPQQSANTILVANRRHDSQVVACVVLANSKLDVNKTVASLMGTKKVSFAGAEQTRKISGMEIGGVTIFGLPESIPVYVDSRVLQQDRIVMGGGNRTSKVLLAPAELNKLPNARVIEGLGMPK
jgi:prolyl-tRNA editing enzyme YbaK/EbsC (Cys-tRNA(Pro) deacylase)